MKMNLKRAIKLLAGEPVGVRLDQSIYDNWTTDADFILDNINTFNNEKVGRFAYNIDTGELVWGDMATMHAIMIHNQSNSPFDNFVRGVYTGDKVMLRWYDPEPYMDQEEIRSKSFDAWYQTKEMLEKNGLPNGMPVELGVDTQTIKDDIPFYK